MLSIYFRFVSLNVPLISFATLLSYILLSSNLLTIVNYYLSSLIVRFFYISIVFLCWQLYLYLTFWPIMSVCFFHKFVSIYWNCILLSYKWEPLLAIKSDWIHYFLHKEVLIPSPKYDNCFPCVWSVWAFDFNIWKRTFHSQFSLYISFLLFYFINKHV